MNNKLLLEQARKGLQSMIADSPESIIIYRKGLTSDGFGGMVEDPFGEPIPYNVKCRISHEKKFPGNYNPASVGFTSNLSRFILVDYNQTIYVDDTFEAIGKRFKIGVVDDLKKFEGIIGYQAPLLEAVSLETDS